MAAWRRGPNAARSWSGSRSHGCTAPTTPARGWPPSWSGGRPTSSIAEPGPGPEGLPALAGVSGVPGVAWVAGRVEGVLLLVGQVLLVVAVERGPSLVLVPAPVEVVGVPPAEVVGAPLAEAVPAEEVAGQAHGGVGDQDAAADAERHLAGAGQESPQPAPAGRLLVPGLVHVAGGGRVARGGRVAGSGRVRGGLAAPG